jgi:PIN domain nuclease of toxin-antitoxin system
MEALTDLDSHPVVWLYMARRDLFSEAARKAIDEGDPAISPIVILELEFLKEIGRVLVDPADIVRELHRTIGSRVCGLEFSRVVECARPLSWTRDPFDRLIVGHAIAAQVVGDLEEALIESSAVVRQSPKTFAICSRTVASLFTSPPPTSAVAQPAKPISSRAFRTPSQGRSPSVISVHLPAARL